jgi:type IV secretory pathway TrbL component
MRSLLMVLAFTCVLLVPVPALAQTSQGDSSGAQYDDNVLGNEAGNGAMNAALLASGALQATPEEAQAAGGSSVSAAESSNAPSERDAAFAEEGDAVSSTEAQTESASTADAQGESANTSGLEKLPQTGGPSPLWLFGSPLICIGAIIARRILLA